MSGLSPSERLNLSQLGLSEHDFVEMDKIMLLQATMAVCTDLPLEIRHSLSDYLNALLWPPEAAAAPEPTYQQKAA